MSSEQLPWFFWGYSY